MRYDFIIVGGGIIGMVTALDLTKNGAKVAIFDRGQLGMEASWAAGGILSSMRPWLENPASAQLSEIGKSIYLAFVEGLKDQTGTDPEYYRSGLNIINREHIDNIKQWALISNIEVSQEVEGLVKDIQEFCKKHTAPYKYPRLIEFRKTLPKTISGKIRRVELRNKN